MISKLTKCSGANVIATDFTRWFLALFFIGVAAFYSLRIVLLKRRISTSPVFTGHPGTLHFATHLAFRTFRVVILAVCVVRLLWPGLDRFLITFDALWHPLVLILGNGLLLASFASIVALNFYMREDWRSGTRLDDRTRIITSGPFAVSRNPMMVCVIIAQIGLFLALPSAFTLICLVVGVWAVNAQVRVEERLLRERFGTTYETYADRTPRWLGFL